MSNIAAESGGAAMGKAVGLVVKKRVANSVSNKMVSSTSKMTKRIQTTTGLNNKTSRKVAQGIVVAQKKVAKGISNAPESISANVTKSIIDEKNKK